MALQEHWTYRALLPAGSFLEVLEVDIRHMYPTVEYPKQSARIVYVWFNTFFLSQNAGSNPESWPQIVPRCFSDIPS